MSSWGVTVDVDAYILHSEGWHHESECNAEGPVEFDFNERTVMEFHDEEHQGAFRWCPHKICVMFKQAEEY